MAANTFPNSLFLEQLYKIRSCILSKISLYDVLGKKRTMMFYSTNLRVNY
jgi:hypothetical protein